MNFCEIEENMKSKTPINFLDAVLASGQEEIDSFIFSPSIDSHFEEAVTYLASEDTLSFSSLLNWRKDNFLVVSQTIDGDYIAGTLDKTYVIPVSLYTADVEQYDYFLFDFFLHYYEGTLDSLILPKL